MDKSRASTWLRRAEELAGLERFEGSSWHAFRRGWATRHKDFPDVDVARAGGWRGTEVLTTIYQQATDMGVRKVLTADVDLREAHVLLFLCTGYLCGHIGAWRSPVAHLLWEQGVPGSNPGAPILQRVELVAVPLEPSFFFVVKMVEYANISASDLATPDTLHSVRLLGRRTESRPFLRHVQFSRLTASLWDNAGMDS